MSTVRERFAAIFANHFDISPVQVKDETSFDSFYADDLDRIDLIIAAEEAFGAELDDRIFDSGIRTFGDAVRALEKKLN